MDIEAYLAIAAGLASGGKAEHLADSAQPARVATLRGLAEKTAKRPPLAERIRKSAHRAEGDGGGQARTLRRLRVQSAPFPEAVWGEVHADGRTVLANVPMLTPDLGFGDVLDVAEPDAPWKSGVIQGVVERGNFSTIVVAVSDIRNGTEPAALTEVIALATAVERKGAIAAMAMHIDQQREALRLLDRGEADGVWTYAVIADRAAAA